MHTQFAKSEKIKSICKEYNSHGLTDNIQSTVGEWIIKEKFELWLALPEKLINEVLHLYDVIFLASRVCKTKNPKLICRFTKAVDEAPVGILIEAIISVGSYEDVKFMLSIPKVDKADKFDKNLLLNFLLKIAEENANKGQ